jgi:hypothetical protein
MSDGPARVLVITDRTDATPELLEAIRHRAEQGPAEFRILVPNPARAEASILHPEHHDAAEEAELTLIEALPAFEAAANGRVIGSVSIRHDPYDAVEELLLDEPIDEFIVAIPPRGLSKKLHLDLPHRLSHFNHPVATVDASTR